MSIFGSLKDKVTQYIDAYIKLFKLNFMGSTAKLMSYFIFTMICLFVVFSIMVLLGFALVEGLIDMGLGRTAAFFTTTGIYICVLLILMGLRKNITRFFAGSIISVLTDDEEGNNQDKAN